MTCFRIGIPYLKRVRSIFVKFLITHFVNLLSSLVVCGIWLVENICKLNKKLIKRIHVVTPLTCTSLKMHLACLLLLPFLPRLPVCKTSVDEKKQRIILHIFSTMHNLLHNILSIPVMMSVKCSGVCVYMYICYFPLFSSIFKYLGLTKNYS